MTDLSIRVNMPIVEAGVSTFGLVLAPVPPVPAELAHATVLEGGTAPVASGLLVELS